jgi:Bacterial protein of unknown function (DUF937)
MAHSPKGIMDIADIVARWHAGHSITRISKALGVDRKTVRSYIHEAKEAGLSLDEPLPARQALLTVLYPLVPHLDRPKPAGTQFEDHREEIIEFITRKIDPLKPKTAYEVVCHRHGVTASYSSFKRFVRRLAPELSASSSGMGGLLGAAGSLLGGGGSSSPASAGAGILANVFGAGQNKVESAVGSASGLDIGQAGKPMAMLAPIVMGVLGKMKSQQGLDASGLAGLLGQERDDLAAKTPALGGLLGMLDSATVISATMWPSWARVCSRVS